MIFVPETFLYRFLSKLFESKREESISSKGFQFSVEVEDFTVITVCGPV